MKEKAFTPLNERKHMCSEERNGMMNYSVGMDAIDKAINGLSDRMKNVGCYAKARRAFGIVVKSFSDLVGSMTVDQMESLKRNVDLMVWDYHVKSPMKNKGLKDDGMWVSLQALDAIVEATRDRCLMCSLDPASQRSCKLAKALDLIPCEHEDVNHKGCRYFNGL